MKIRTSFVSNSSSSSYIIVVKKSDSPPCRHCGRGDLNIIELLEKCMSGYGDDSCINKSDAKSIIEDYQEQISERKKNINSQKFRLASLEKNNGAEKDIDGCKNWICWLEEDIELCKEMIDKIKKINKDNYSVLDISISYHDTTINNLFRQLKNSGKIQVLSENDG